MMTLNTNRGIKQRKIEGKIKDEDDLFSSILIEIVIRTLGSTKYCKLSIQPSILICYIYFSQYEQKKRRNHLYSIEMKNITRENVET